MSYIKTGVDLGHTGKVIIDGQGRNTNGIDALGNHQLIIDGSSGLGLTNLVIRNFFNATNNSTGIGLAYGGNQNGWVHHLEIYDCNIGIYNSGDPINSIISHCYLHNIRGNAGIQLNNASTKAWDTTIVSNVTIIVNFDTNQTPATGADGIQGASGITVCNCYFGTQAGTNVQNQHPDAFQNAGEFNKMYNCEVVDVVNAAWEGGSAQVNSGNMKFYNNIVRRTSATTWTAYNRGIEWNVLPGPAPTSLTNVHIYNNTFIDLTNWFVITFTYAGGQPSFADFNIKNNIFYNCTDPGHGSVIKIWPSTNYVPGAITIDYNTISAGAHGQTTLTVNNEPYTQAHPRTGTSAFRTYLECSPSNDLRLDAADTAARAQGYSLANYFSTDKNGATRFTPRDIGPYVYSTLPPPQNLRVR